MYRHVQHSRIIRSTQTMHLCVLYVFHKTSNVPNNVAMRRVPATVFAVESQNILNIMCVCVCVCLCVCVCVCVCSIC
jgi:hypothetical protein